MKKDVPITRSEWEGVLENMTKFNRNSGYVDFIDFNNGKVQLTFFDHDPRINGIKALAVTRTSVIEAILAYPETNIAESQFGVHQSHCCEQEGCKYGCKDCPVVLRIVKQKYACEGCDCGFKNC